MRDSMTNETNEGKSPESDAPKEARKDAPTLFTLVPQKERVTFEREVEWESWSLVQVSATPGVEPDDVVCLDDHEWRKLAKLILDHVEDSDRG